MDSFELNKILGAILGTCLVLLVTSFTADAIFAPKMPEKPGYAIAAKEEPHGGGGGAKEAAPAPPEPIEKLLQTASVEKGAAAAKLVTSRTRQVPRIAPRILLSSKESILDQGSRPERSTLGRRGTAAKCIRNQAFAPHPSHDQISVCPCSGNPYKCAGFHPIPIISGPRINPGPDLTPMPEPRTLVLIPARMAAVRLPGKPLLDLAGLPMIVHVLRRAEAAKIGRVAVATDTPEIAAVVTSHGGEAVMTRPDHPSGSDRIYEALCKLDPAGEAEIVVNLQGDFPTIAPENIRDVLAPLNDPAVDIATLAAEIHTEEESLNPNVVKAVGSLVGPGRLRALYFTRATAPFGDGPRYHHIGLYAYRRAALERYVALPPSPLERQEKLEQLRALEAGMRIDIGIVDKVPRGVDTPADLETTRRVLAKA